MANVLDSIMNIIKSNVFSLNDYKQKYHDTNRMNNQGRAFEEFMKDSYADSIHENDINKRLEALSYVFDYTGNNSNPPDAMLKGGNDGDAIEFKKIDSYNSSLALNSSFPNHKLYKNSNMLSQSSKNIPNWDCRDLLYVIGSVDRRSSNINYIFMLYGLDYAADNKVYIDLKQKLTTGINSIPGFDFQKTRELGRLNSVDPLGITYLRIRGMWGIENPVHLFTKDIPIDYYYKHQNVIVFAVNNDKWNTFNNRDEFMKFVSQTRNLGVKNIKIQDPNNPVNLKNGKLIVYVK